MTPPQQEPKLTRVLRVEHFAGVDNCYADRDFVEYLKGLIASFAPSTLHDVQPKGAFREHHP